MLSKIDNITLFRSSAYRDGSDNSRAELVKPKEVGPSKEIR